MNILQISMSDIGGGAEKIGWVLHHGYRERDYNSWMAVCYKQSQDVNVIPIPNDTFHNIWTKIWKGNKSLLSRLDGRIRSIRRVRNLCCLIDQIFHQWKVSRGYENFNFSGSWHLLDLPPQRPDILHAHNLHASSRLYFDLRTLPWLSKQVPVVLTLHDAWLLSGHCAHSFDCERWKIGCGQCPDLTIPPPICTDATAYNWRRKRKIYRKSKLSVATPSQWLMKKVRQSILAPAVIKERIIPNGVDLSVFSPMDKQAARSALGISSDEKMLLFTASWIRHSVWKDYQTLRNTVHILAEHLHKQNVLFVALGESGQTEQIGRARIQFVPYQNDQAVVARYYQAADIYLHAAKVDTFPNTVLEALACGTPVVATAVGGISEQIEHGVTGFLVPPGDAESMARAILKLLQNIKLRKHIGFQAAETARQQFDQERMIDDYLDWYYEILHLYYHG